MRTKPGLRGRIAGARDGQTDPRPQRVVVGGVVVGTTVMPPLGGDVVDDVAVDVVVDVEGATDAGGVASVVVVARGGRVVVALGAAVVAGTGTAGTSSVGGRGSGRTQR